MTKTKRKASNVELTKSGEADLKGKATPIVSIRPDSTLVLFPPGVSAFREPSSFLKKLSDLLFPADEEYLKGKKMEKVYDAGLLSTF